MNSKIARALAFPAVIALVAGLLGFLAVTALSHSQKELYSARVTVFVVPSTKGGVVDPAYPTVSAANLAAAAEYVHSPSVTGAIHQAVPGSPDPEAIGAAITADPIPESTVVRFAVTNGSKDMAMKMATALGNQLEKADIFGNVGHFKALDAEAPFVQQISPDKKLGTGLALVIGTILAVVAAGLWLMLLPRILFRSQLKRAVDDPTIAVVDATTPAKAARGFDFLRHVPTAELMAVGKDTEGTVARIAGHVPEGLAADGAQRDVVLLVPRGETKPSELNGAIGILERAGRKLLAVALV